MTWLAIKLLFGGALKRLWGWLGSVFTFVREKPALAAIVLLAGLSGWLWYTRGEARDQRDAAVAGRAADRTAYVQAQAEAHRLALAAKAATEARYTSLAKEADNEFQTELADARSDAERYIASHRVRPEAASRAGGKAVGSADNRDSGGGERPGDAPFMVAVAEADIGVCTTNTLRLEAVRDWALSLAE